jgi:adenylylsulfate kinase
MVKAFSWRGLSLLITTAVAWKVIHRFDLAASVGLIDLVVKLGLFYLHERCWSKTTFGIRQPQYEI